MARAHRTIPPLTDNDLSRFWSKVRVHWNNPDACWEWTACLNNNGYGKFSVVRVIYYANRVSFSICNGEIPSGLNVCHKCDNPVCVNPNHLFLGTQLDNLRDAKAKGRMTPPNRPTGEASPLAKLNNQIVAAIRCRSAQGETLRAIGKRFGVSDVMISLVVRGLRWKHVV